MARRLNFRIIFVSVLPFRGIIFRSVFPALLLIFVNSCGYHELAGGLLQTARVVTIVTLFRWVEGLNSAATPKPF